MLNFCNTIPKSVHARSWGNYYVWCVMMDITYNLLAAASSGVSAQEFNTFMLKSSSWLLCKKKKNETNPSHLLCTHTPLQHGLFNHEVILCQTPVEHTIMTHISHVFFTIHKLSCLCNTPSPSPSPLQKKMHTPTDRHPKDCHFRNWQFPGLWFLVLTMMLHWLSSAFGMSWKECGIRLPSSS